MRAVELLSQGDVLPTFAVIAGALGCTEPSSEALVWIACEKDEAIHAKYAKLFDAD